MAGGELPESENNSFPFERKWISVSHWPLGNLIGPKGKGAKEGPKGNPTWMALGITCQERLSLAVSLAKLKNSQVHLHS